MWYKVWFARYFICLFLLAVGVCGCSLGGKKIEVSTYKEPAIILPERPKPYSIDGVYYYPLPRADGFVQEGIASWYGKEFHGKKTANGEIYNMYGKTAAHRTLPLGTYVKVENLSNEKEIVVRINDRGPFIKGRIVDLSYGAAREIGLVGPGIAKVRLVALSKGVGSIGYGNKSRPLVEAKDFNKGPFTIQVGSFQNKENAQHLAERLKVILEHVTITRYEPHGEKTFYRVRVSLAIDFAEADKIVEKLKYLGFSEAFIVAL